MGTAYSIQHTAADAEMEDGDYSTRLAVDALAGLVSRAVWRQIVKASACRTSAVAAEVRGVIG